jgi:hypothetical protein
LDVFKPKEEAGRFELLGSYFGLGFGRLPFIPDRLRSPNPVEVRFPASDAPRKDHLKLMSRHFVTQHITSSSTPYSFAASADSSL